ncbi:MAG TPA: hypothetical protein PKK06_08370 [Phycisphaerae bacterium]|nr:hypothetical protein [Phycisphaerae bacterium]HNU43676.1 hypothetical protein [Phycisphaerae bacterium]
MAVRRHGRTYQRETVGMTEQIVAVVILGLLGTIVVAFLATGFRPGPALFASQLAGDEAVPASTTTTVTPASPDATPPPPGPTTATALPAPPTSPDTTAGTGPPFPAVLDTDWLPPTNAATYTADDLWEKINGRADLYLAFHVARLWFGTYRRSSDPDAALDVYRYDMGSPENAFGIYQAESGGDVEAVDVGREAYVAGGSVIFWKGNHYVRVEAPDESDAYAQGALAVARALADALLDDGQPLWAESLLPSAGRVPRSLAYQTGAAFGLDSLGEVFHGRYEREGTTFVLFIHRATSPQEAQGLYEGHRASLRQLGILQDGSTESPGLLLVEAPDGRFEAVFVHGTYVAGVLEAGSAAAAAEAARWFRTQLAQ